MDITIEFDWIPTYCNVEENKIANHITKTAIGWLFKQKINGYTTKINTDMLVLKTTKIFI